MLYIAYLFRELQTSTREALEKLAMAEAKATTMQTGRAHYRICSGLTVFIGIAAIVVLFLHH